ncbi:MAG: penicillin-binding protein 1A [Acidobacteriota bacterium]
MNDMNTRLTRNRSYLFWTSYLLVLLCVIVVGALGGLMFGYAFSLPQVEQLEEVRPNIVSYVYAADGRVLGEFALEHRILVAYHEIPEIVKQAIVSAEDGSFFKHTGIDFISLFKTAVKDIVYRELKGASTLTMQLSKLRFTNHEKILERKIKDMLYALEIEQRYSKEQIFTFYCNQIPLGHGTYGIAAASDFYFGKTLDELTVAEAALLAGIIQLPQTYSPINHPKRALARREYALERMLAEGYIDHEALAEAQNEPLQLQVRARGRKRAPYFVEAVRQYLAEKYEMDKIWTAGLRVHTTVNYDFQLAARDALREGLKQLDKRTGRWTGAEENILEKKQDLDEYYHPEWRQIFFEGQMIHGLVLEVSPEKALVKMGSYRATIGPEDVKWSGRRLDQALKPGDVAVFTIQEIDSDKRTIEAVLDRIPKVQGSIMAIENTTGAIKAIVGGFDFDYSKFNRATQALRQPGSIFKPFTYVAAMENGYSPFDTVLDAPISFTDALGRQWSPQNSDHQFRGLITIQQALAGSRNLPTVRLANALGIEKIIDVAHRFGLPREIPPYLPVALGASEVTLQEITSAFTVFPNGGVRALPWFIERVEDYNGVTLEQQTQRQVQEVLSPETAGKMLYMLQNVVKWGTAARAGRAFDRPLGGKTGTTNEATDAWFVGFVPQITAGVWVGYDEKKSLGERAFGANIALPIWIDFMEEVLEKIPTQEFENSYKPGSYQVAEEAQRSQEPVSRPVAVTPTEAPAIVEENIPAPEL